MSPPTNTTGGRIFTNPDASGGEVGRGRKISDGGGSGGGVGVVGGGGGGIHEVSLHTGGVRNQETIFSLERAQGMGGESKKLTCSSTALDSKSEKSRAK